MDENEQEQPEDLEEPEAAVLPAREAMSIIAPDAALSGDRSEESASSESESAPTSDESRPTD
jgi:hypothetical protein